MAEERFPRRRMISQLRKLDYELTTWRAQYGQAEHKAEATWLAGKFAERGSALELMQEHIAEIRQLLVDFPRLS